jgi:hypothetical protein
MNRIKLAITGIVMLFSPIYIIGVNANNPYFGSTMKGGVKILSLQSLNDALQHEGLAKLNSTAFSYTPGMTKGNEKFVLNCGFDFFVATGKENSNYSRLSGFGYSMEYGRVIWRNDRMCLYPYLKVYYFWSRLRTFQGVNANSFASVYAQPLVERSFNNIGELDAALGLSFQIKITKDHLLRVGGGYNFRLLQGKWYYFDKVDFPKVDCRGWEIGITWGIIGKKHKKSKKSDYD